MNRDELLKPSRKISKWPYILLGIGMVILLAALTVLFITRQPADTLPYPIPESGVKQLGFDIYYPSQKLLPSGYLLNKNSFVVNSSALIYTVSYGVSGKIVFSDESKPTVSQIQDFYTKDMPLNSTFSTPNGKATIGTINTRTVVSLPTDTNSWLLITAPGNTNQNDLKQVVDSIRPAKNKRSFPL